ncbi:transposase [Streptomyces sp. NPDC058293]|uniref:transposase n=1 Tax=unclassified Streptomyces TaxID=2593676 RepID=UPI00224E9CD9|nr:MULTISPECIES: transposase [unclassified Streptomyces]MCX5322366.1 transposase [Streptomyces sp. NBC_00120]
MHLCKEFDAHVRRYLWGGHFWAGSYFAGSCGGAPLTVLPPVHREPTAPRTARPGSTAQIHVRN